ncbi:DUF1109 domain-containing protein [Thioclava kandeliae]|uniref:DUF1109 domain-containing protein n=1 Tax=Thioclava kandeliae TaxID=3070818 RepID=A0ABV1SBC1_9RHOB
METENLIAALSADTTPPRYPHLRLRLLAGGAVSIALMVLLWGPRPDWSEAIRTLPVLLKQTLPLAFALLLARPLARPVEDRPASLRAPLALMILCGLVWGCAMIGGGNLWGRTWWICLLSIPALGLPIGGFLFVGLRRRIVVDGSRTGWIAGLFAGALAAMIYAIHCDDDGPAFYLLWYGAAILICGLAGRIAGRQLLRL